MKSNNYCYCKF